MGVIDLTGQSFGKLTVLKRNYEPHNGKEAWWTCLCECGNKKAIRGSDLRRGKTKSCGCLSAAQAKENIKIAQKFAYKVDLTNKKFGLLTALYPTGKSNNQHYMIWHCKCECGNECESDTQNLQRGHKLSCGCLNSLGEQIISSLLTENNIVFQQQKTFENCRFPDTNKLARFDFYIDNRYLLEFDGIQHYSYTNKDWNIKEHYIKTKEHDEYKNQWCKDNGIVLIRIPYWKINDLKFDNIWVDSLESIINKTQP